MQHSIKIPLNFLVWVLIGISMFLVYPSIGDSNESEAMVICGRNLSISDNVDLGGLDNLLDAVVVEVENTRAAYNNSMVSNQRIYAFGQCYDEQKPEDCNKCIRETRSNFNQCLPYRSGRVYFDHCYLRYDNYDFIGETINHRYDKVNCGSPPDHGDDDFMKDEFTRRVNIAMVNLTAVALKNDNFAFVEDRGVEGIYAIAQCWKPINEAECRKCLLSARTSVTKRCLPSREGTALFAGCYMKYSTERFYNITADVIDEDDDFKVGIVVISWVALFALLLLAFFGAHLGYMKVSLMKEAMNGNNGGTNNSKMNFKYEVLERATDSFDMTRKLGQGGAGSVYKGILPNGKIIAVKRLFFTNRQWVDEFFNEVNLIGGIQHKNLVKLLGCSIEGPESLLVYEYVPNKSLYQVLFDKTSDLILSWKQRFDVILGIAEGLAYLHGGCDVKIIHRDIKTSNILLDEYLVPKIADFGLARCVDPDRSHVSTGIAGTLGYMAPEYLVRGQLTEKADIYAFGVMVLEIACGRKNTIFTQGSNSVLHSVWKNYKADNITESVDSVLKSNLPIKEASNVLQIGLLCTQALSSLRPSMFEVVEMLKNEDSEVPKPRQPPFLNASVLNVEDSFCFTGNTTGSIGKSCSESSFYTIDSTTSFSRTQLKLKDTSINASG